MCINEYEFNFFIYMHVNISSHLLQINKSSGYGLEFKMYMPRNEIETCQRH